MHIRHIEQNARLNISANLTTGKIVVDMKGDGDIRTLALEMTSDQAKEIIGDLQRAREALIINGHG